MDDNLMDENVVPEVPEKQGSQKRIIAIIAAVVVVLVLCCCVILVTVFAVDPFGWGLLGRLTGNFDPVAQAMPEDTGIYIGFNLLNMTPEKINRLLEPFRGAIEEATGEQMGSYDDLIQELDTLLAEDTNLSFEEDILSWIGQYAGLGFWDFEFNDYGDLEDPSFVFAVEVRDRGAADEFIQKLQAEIADSSGDDFLTEEYEGVEIYELDTDYDYERVAFARSGNLFLLSMDAETIKSAIDAGKDASMGDDRLYKDLMKDLPKERALTFYLSGDQLEQMYDTLLSSRMMGLSGSALNMYESVDGITVSAAITDEGLQFDSVMAYDLETMTEAQKELLELSRSQGKTADLFPEETIVYLTGAHLDLVWNTYRDILADSVGVSDYDEMMRELENEIGFDIENDVLAYLDGEYAFGLFPTSEGMLASQLEVDLGLGMVLEVSDQEQILSVMDDFINLLEENDMSVNEVSTDDATMYEAVDYYMEEPVFSFGVGNDLMGFATSTSDLEGFYTGDSSLSDSQEYRDVWKAFPGDVTPAMYFDVKSLMGVIREGLSGYALEDFEEAAPVFDPIEYIAAGSVADKNVVHSIVIFFLPSP